ncbi:hypothetical protein LCGC14_0510290 [marine sediment metagenome]|uniref:Uncharacterized protein n=1 Tax=marine sediment metagenome TaxID=412755 RepID=A0A0F9V9U3_9ZZZZ
MNELEIRHWVGSNASSLMPETNFTPEELDHIAMCIEHLYRWYSEGYPIGDFLTAVAQNNFSEACFRADDTNRKALYLYALFLANKVPLWNRKAKEKEIVGAKDVQPILVLCRNVFDFAEHGDYSNGVEAYGMDEGVVRSGEILDKYREELEKYERE